MQTWLTISEFSKLVGKSIEEVEELCKNGKLEYKEDNGNRLIEATMGTQAIVPISTEVEDIGEKDNKGSIFEKTIATILNLHERVLESKDETLETLREENQFLKESLIAMQELYDEDRKSMELLQKQLKISQEELEFMRRKYKLMWGKIIDTSNKE